MRNLDKLLMVVAVEFLLIGCAISHTYGPYMGKVVNKETDEPIEGAVVFMEFSTKSGNIGGSTTYFADAIEVLTDTNGDFLIPPYQVRVFRAFHKWDKHGDAIVFKPGYGAFPGHQQSLISHYKDHEFPDNELVVIQLPELKTRKERSENAIFNLWLGSGVPEGKYQLFEKLKKNELHYLDRGN